MFPEEKIGFFATMVGNNNAALSIMMNRFIATILQNDTFCTKSNETYNSAIGVCSETVPVASLSTPSASQVSQWKQLEGCYRNSRYERTTWAKIYSIFSPVYCVVPGEKMLTLPLQQAVLVPKPLESDNKQLLFKVGASVNNSVMFSTSNPLMASFIFLDSNHATYMLIEQATFEFTNQSLAFFAMLQLSIVCLILLQCCCCCGCVGLYSLCDIKTYVDIFKNRSIKKESDSLAQYELEFDDDEEVDTRRLARIETSPVRAQQEHVQTKTQSKALLALVIVFTLLTIIGIHSVIL